MKKLLIIVATVGGIVALWMMTFQLVSAFNPPPLESPPQLSGTSEVPTAEPVIVRLHYAELVEQVVPATGMTIDVAWGDMGQRLIEAGAIDLEKFESQYGGFTEEQREILLGDDLEAITFTPENIQFWTNVLWAFGLTQQSKVLDEGPIMQNSKQTPIGYYASTGGWTLGSQEAEKLYNSVQFVELTPEQDALVYRIAEHIFRPCCGNSTVFPDCNHGMAVLGLLALMASQGADEQEMVDAALAFNSYAFPDTYITLAAYFAGQGIDWSETEPAVVLDSEYSSGQGARRIAAQVGPIPGSPNQGGSCST